MPLRPAAQLPCGHEADAGGRLFDLGHDSDLDQQVTAQSTHINKQVRHVTTAATRAPCRLRSTQY